jgi:hypothetical protein
VDFIRILKEFEEAGTVVTVSFGKGDFFRGVVRGVDETNKIICFWEEGSSGIDIVTRYVPIDAIKCLTVYSN